MTKYEVHLKNGDIVHNIECDKVKYMEYGIYFVNDEPDENGRVKAFFYKDRVKTVKEISEEE